jgi:putative spermidine/putrescine transport system permease protein
MSMSRPRLGARNNWLLLLPALALLTVVLFIPLIQSFVASIASSPDSTTWTLDNYVSLFTDGITLKVLGRTGYTALAVTVICLVLGYPYAYVMTRVGPRWRGILLTIVLIPFWTSTMARNFAWIIILQDGGPLQQFFSFFGLDRVVLYGTTAGVITAMSQVMLPFMVLPLFSALGGIDRKLLLAARGLGSSPIVAFWKIYWPLSRGGVIAGLILVFTLSGGFYVTPALVGSPQQSQISQLLGQRMTELLDFAGAGALGTLILVVTLVLVAWANRLGGSVHAIGAVAETGRAPAREDKP